MASFPIIPNGPLRDFVFRFLATLGTAWLEVLVFKGNAFTRDTVKVPLNSAADRALWAFCVQGSAGKRGVALLARSK